MPEPQDVESGAPYHSNGFGAAEAADAARQAQFDRSDDSPTDVNCNAALARNQAGTFDAVAKSFASNNDRRDKIFDLIAAKMGLASA